MKTKQIIKDMQLEAACLEQEGQRLIDKGTPLVRQGEDMQQQAFDVQIDTLKSLGYEFKTHRGGWGEVLYKGKLVRDVERAGYDFLLVEAAIKHAKSEVSHG